MLQTQNASKNDVLLHFYDVSTPQQIQRKTRIIGAYFEGRNLPVKTSKMQNKTTQRGRREPRACKTRCFLRRQPGNHAKHDVSNKICSQKQRLTAFLRCFHDAAKTP